MLGKFSSYRDEVREITELPDFFIGKMYLRPDEPPNTTSEEAFMLHFVLMQLDAD